MRRLKKYVRQIRYQNKTSHLPPGANARPALDVGCGPFPIPGADFVADIEYQSFDLPEMQAGLKGRFVRCDIHHLPFAASAFEFVHCSNVLEHTADPELAFSELKRAGKHGFAETPSAFFEKIVNHSPRHRWIISWRGDAIVAETMSGIKWFGGDVYMFSPPTWWIRRTAPLLWKAIMFALDVVLDLSYNKYRW